MSRYSEVLESIFTSENKYTVLQLLKALISAVEEMAGHTVTTIDLEQSGTTAGQPTDILVRFTFDDDTTDEFTIVIPPGARGYSITSAEITDDNHLVVTFGDGSTEDAGTIRGSKLYRHVIKLVSNIATLYNYAYVVVIDGNEKYTGIDSFFNNYAIPTSSPLVTQEFLCSGSVTVDSSTSQPITRLHLRQNDNNTYTIVGFGTTQYTALQRMFEDNAYPISLVAKGDQGEKGKYIEVTAINAVGDVTEAGQRYSMVFTEKDPANPSYSNTYDKQFLVPRGPQGPQGPQGYQGISVNAIDIIDDGITDQGHQHTLEMEFTDPAYGTHFTRDAEFYTTDRRVVRTGTVSLNSDNVYDIILPDIPNVFYPIIIRIESQDKFDLWCAIFDVHNNEQAVQKINTFRTNKLNLSFYGCNFGCEDNTDPAENYISFDLPQVAEPPSSLRYTIEYEKYVPYLEGPIISV